MRYHHCLKTHSRASTNMGIMFRHDLLETMQSIDAQVNAKPTLGWIYTTEMRCVLHGPKGV